MLCLAAGPPLVWGGGCQPLRVSDFPARHPPFGRLRKVLNAFLFSTFRLILQLTANFPIFLQLSAIFQIYHHVSPPIKQHLVGVHPHFFAIFPLEGGYWNCQFQNFNFLLFFKLKKLDVNSWADDGDYIQHIYRSQIPLFLGY